MQLSKGEHINGKLKYHATIFQYDMPHYATWFVPLIALCNLYFDVGLGEARVGRLKASLSYSLKQPLLI